MSVWKASVNDVKELPSQVSFHVSVPWGVVPYDFSLVVSFALWLWVVRELVFVAALVKRFLIRRSYVRELGCVIYGFCEKLLRNGWVEVTDIEISKVMEACTY